MPASLRGIAYKAVRRGEMILVPHAFVGVLVGVKGDRIGATSKRRQVTLLRAEDWADAVAEIGVDLPWTARRANLLVEGLPRFEGQTGQRLRIGTCVLEITGETDPCSRMVEVHSGLQTALMPHWRGGALCTVIGDGDIALGDDIFWMERV
jgi:MOSC domain-containing protein YiiM